MKIVFMAVSDIWDYAGGLMTDWGVHMLDMVLGGMNVSDPISVAAIGGKMAFPLDASGTPDTLTTVYDFGNCWCGSNLWLWVPAHTLSTRDCRE
jgi:predicted dehydrogenase